MRPVTSVILGLAAPLAVACVPVDAPPEVNAGSAADPAKPAKSAPAPADPATPGPNATAPDAAPAAAPTGGRPPSGTKLHPGDRGFDCGRMLTRNEIETACGEPMGSVNIDAMEGRKPMVACSRRWRHEDKRTVSMIVSKHETVEAAQGLSTPAGATDVPGIADAAHSYREDRGGVILWDTLRFRSGQRVIYLRSITEPGGTPLCDAGELQLLAGEVSGRLEQVVP